MISVCSHTTNTPIFFSTTGWHSPVPTVDFPNIILPLVFFLLSHKLLGFGGLPQRHRERAPQSRALLAFYHLLLHLIAGPILHHRQMMPQFAHAKTYRISQENIAIGLTIFAIGMFKKVIIADSFPEYANPVFAVSKHTGALSLQDAWLGCLAYTLQLYFDFSAYSDMAIGLSHLFGIKMPLNFNSPYKSTSIIDFWNRWHITLSQFLRQYLYFALGGNRKGKARRYINMMLTMLLGGLWHGAGWTFVVWGGLHGIFLVINHLFREIFLWRAQRVNAYPWQCVPVSVGFLRCWPSLSPW
ncbi:MAG: MBOAT family O-acyltransferase [Pseudomonadales bacterium]